MQAKLICILGGTGFVGSHLVNRLTREGYRIRVLTRRRERNRHLLVMPTLELNEADVQDPTQLRAQLCGCDAVINLVGILNEKGHDGRGFHQTHVGLARKVVDACQANGIRRLLQMSALNADACVGASHYLRTKGEAEDLVHRENSHEFRVTSFRPSVIFGPRDRFFNRFAKLLRLCPFVFPLACASTRFSPVYVGDVTQAFVTTLNIPEATGKRYELCGPHEYTLQQLVEYTAEVMDLSRRVIPLSDKLSLRQAKLLQMLPGKPFSQDNYSSLQVNSVCAGENGLQALGIHPVALESVVPKYLGRRSQRARYHEFRELARRR